MNAVHQLVAAFVLTVIMAPVAVGANGSDNPCRYEDTRSISFRSWEATEIATVRILGRTCSDSVVLVTITSSDGYAMFAHAAVMEALTATPTDELKAEDALSIADLVWSTLGPGRTSDLQPWKEPQEIYDLFDEIPLLRRDEYEEARQSDRPYICFQDYYEGADCYWVNPKRGIQKLVRLSD